MAGLSGAEWSPVDAVTFGWKALTSNFVGVSLPIVVGLIVAQLPAQAIGLGYAATATIVADLVDPSFIAILGYLVQATSALIGLVVQSYIMGGLTNFALKVVRGQPVSFGDVFSGGKYFGPMLVGAIGAAIATAIGVILCVIPAFIVAYGLQMYTYLIVDKGLAGIDALKRSWELTKGHKVNLFVYSLLGLGVAFAGLLACGIGLLLVSIPVLFIGTAYIYCRLNGEQPRLAGT
jgi:uncharacterized membrane protein